MTRLTAAYANAQSIFVEFRSEHGVPFAATTTLAHLQDPLGSAAPFSYRRASGVSPPVDAKAVPIVHMSREIHSYSYDDLLAFMASQHPNEPIVVAFSPSTVGYQKMSVAIRLPKQSSRQAFDVITPQSPGGFYRTPTDWIAFILLYPFAVIGDVLTFWLVPLMP